MLEEIWESEIRGSGNITPASLADCFPHAVCLWAPVGGSLLPADLDLPCSLISAVELIL